MWPLTVVLACGEWLLCALLFPHGLAVLVPLKQLSRDPTCDKDPSWAHLIISMGICQQNGAEN